MAEKAILLLALVIVAQSCPSIASPNDLSCGNRMPGDELVLNEIIRENTFDKDVPIALQKSWPLKLTSITKYAILDKTPAKQQRANVSIEITSNTFQVLFESFPGNGIYYDVKIWAN